MTPTDLIRSAASAAWAPILTAPDEPPITDEKGERVGRLNMLFGEHTRDLAPRMDRNEALALGCLLVDTSIAVFHGRKFMPGALSRTPGLEGMTDRCAMALIDRHVKGDWGDVSDQDREANEVALRGGGRLLSVYKDVRDGDSFWVKVWVMTDAYTGEDEDREDEPRTRYRLSTLVLLPSEY